MKLTRKYRDVYDFMLFFNTFLYEIESFREYHKIIDVPNNYSIPLANALCSDSRQANKSDPLVTESEPCALASGIVNNS